ncbi:hypothetical protein [Variovorax boronicumulans]|uniref:hypothetical protein n=1 Tax=Variovorax boronicumulans TaxID=436515 RepID=UPI0007847522|nr:hypothetical protein [Variovorax boronicumulans]
MSVQVAAPVRQPRVRLSGAFLGAVLALTLGGCASHYVDGALKDIDAVTYVKPATPAPVQVLFDFETKGVSNSRATEALKKQVISQVEASGLFSTAGEKPVPNGAMLGIKINNVPVQDDAFSKGVVAGMTFGLAGSQVSDGYICTVNYVMPGKAPVVKVVRHAIHTTVGASASPGNATKAKTLEDAAITMTRQIVGNALNDLSRDPAFN